MSQQIKFSAGKSSPAGLYLARCGRSPSIDDWGTLDSDKALSDSIVVNRAFERLNDIYLKSFPYRLAHDEWTIILNAYNNGASNIRLEQIDWLVSACFDEYGVEFDVFNEAVASAKSNDEPLEPFFASLLLIAETTHIERICIAEIIERFWCKHNLSRNQTNSVENTIAGLTGRHPSLCIGITSEDAFWSKFDVKKTDVGNGLQFLFELDDELVAELNVRFRDDTRTEYRIKTDKVHPCVEHIEYDFGQYVHQSISSA
jgi:hypothetical protein